jgi:hypothetical protein
MDDSYSNQDNISRCGVKEQDDNTREAQFDSDAISSQQEDLRCPSDPL